MAEFEKEVEATESAPATSKKKKEAAPVQKKKNLFVRIGQRLKKLGRDYKSEMSKVVWMTGKDVRKSTLLVCVTVVAIGVAIGIVDFVFSEVIGGFAGLIG
jgi:preprotein translocase SecE subunit